MSKCLALGLVTVATLLTGASAAAAAERIRHDLPLSYHGHARQVITVVANDAKATIATLTAWQRGAHGWQRVVGPVRAYLGSDGIGQASETTSKTPAGVWTLTEAFGIQPNEGTRLPYRRVGTWDWWVSDTTSPLYNTYQHCKPGTCRFNESASENLGATGPVYNHAVVINYNRNPIVSGAGSAFFLHISNGKPTAGCVSIPAHSLKAVMHWLNPTEHPVIDVGIRHPTQRRSFSHLSALIMSVHDQDNGAGVDTEIDKERVSRSRRLRVAPRS
jgi:L,D-peptidoglycan transpeptidase YkuD (ErfK/YbiS/YcfS/YnhG family)